MKAREHTNDKCTHLLKSFERDKLHNVTLSHFILDRNSKSTCVNVCCGVRVCAHLVPSASSSSMAVKSAPPTPTMIMDMGRHAAAMMALLVSSTSAITPSVSNSRT